MPQPHAPTDEEVAHARLLAKLIAVIRSCAEARGHGEVAAVLTQALELVERIADRADELPRLH